MTPSELADKLEEYEAKGLMESLSTAMFLNLPTILKSLRFAADMEVLISEGRCPSFYHKGDDNLANMGINAIQLSVYDGGERVHFYGRDAAAALRQCSERLYGENR